MQEECDSCEDFEHNPQIICVSFVAVNRFVWIRTAVGRDRWHGPVARKLGCQNALTAMEMRDVGS